MWYGGFWTFDLSTNTYSLCLHGVTAQRSRLVADVRRCLVGRRKPCCKKTLGWFRYSLAASIITPEVHIGRIYVQRSPASHLRNMQGESGTWRVRVHEVKPTCQYFIQHGMHSCRAGASFLWRVCAAALSSFGFGGCSRGFVCRLPGAAGLRWGFKIHKGYITRRSGCSDEYLHAKGLYVRLLYVISRNIIQPVCLESISIYLSIDLYLCMFLYLCMHHSTISSCLSICVAIYKTVYW